MGKKAAEGSGAAASEKGDPEIILNLLAGVPSANGSSALSLRSGRIADGSHEIVWNQAIALPLSLADVPLDMGMAVGDLNGDQHSEVIVAALMPTNSGAKLIYAVGRQLDAHYLQVAWGPWLPVGNSGDRLPASAVGLGASIAQTTLNPKLELILTVLMSESHQVTARTLIGVNLEPTGKPEGWIARDQVLGPSSGVPVGLGTAVWTQILGGSNLALLWAEQTDAGAFGCFAVLKHIALAPPYKPTETDLKTEGDVMNHLSVAAVKAQQIAGIRSPHQMKMRVEEVLKELRANQVPLARPVTTEAGQQPTKDELLQVIPLVLDRIEPRIPSQVRPELTRLILVLYRKSPEVKL